MDVHPPKNGINRYWSIPIWFILIYLLVVECGEPSINQAYGHHPRKRKNPPGAEWRRPNFRTQKTSRWRERGHLMHPGQEKIEPSMLHWPGWICWWICWWASTLEHIIAHYSTLKPDTWIWESGNLDVANSDSVLTHLKIIWRSASQMPLFATKPLPQKQLPVLHVLWGTVQ